MDIFDTDAVAPATLRAYRGHYERFEGDVTSVDDVVAHLSRLRSEGKAVSTLTQCAAALTWVAKRQRVWPAGKDVAVEDYIASYSRATTAMKQQAAPLSYSMLMEAKRAGAIDRYQFRLVGIGLGLGLRRSELVAIRDGDFDGRRLFVPEAKQGSRHVLVSPKVAALIAEQQRCRKRLQGEYLFPGRAGTPHISAPVVNRAVKAIAAACGADPAEYSAHSLRAGYVRSALDLGVSPDEIARQTGHASTEMVLAYGRRWSSAEQATEILV